MKHSKWTTIRAATLLPLISVRLWGVVWIAKKTIIRRIAARARSTIANSRRNSASMRMITTSKTETMRFQTDSRWNNDYANRLQPGYVLDRDMQR